MRNFQPCSKMAGGMFALALALICVSETSLRAQRMSDRERDLRDRETRITLMERGVTAAKRDPKREPQLLLQQVREDFKNLQGLNNKMMAEAWSQPELDYRYISEMISQIRGKAIRLQSKLQLPKPETDQAKLSEDALSDTAKFKTALLQLDKHIMSFATNPLFQKPDVFKVDLAQRASRDLAAAIELSGTLKRVAGKLVKPGTPSQ
jgi:hypothetical protein